MPLHAETVAEPAVTRAVEARKTVTVLFCDVAGSTSLGEQFDPEAMRNVITTYFERIRSVIERHGGTVEKFIGDAIMAAFGIPVVHEDDALRAVRAAYEMREELSGLGAELERDWGVAVRLRTGVNTGEVVAGDASARETFATGDTVNTAARLEAAAPPGEILIGEDTYRLVRDAVEVEPVEPLELKGKAEPVPAYRLVAVYQHTEGRRRALDSPLVGRQEELGLLQAAFDAAVTERTCRLVTIYAPAGTGKSRLTRELIETLAESARVLVGRCVPYGDGITYFPLALVVRELAGIDDEGSRAEARARLDALFPDSDDAAAIGRPLAVAIGLDEAVVRPEEIAWAARRLFERVAMERPLVIVFEDIHWAEPTFLALIEHLAAHTRETLLLICPTRPELLEQAPSWGEFAPGHLAITLQPLGADECELLIANMLGTDAVSAGLRDRIIEAAEGNPLYVEEMLRMLVDDGLLRRDDAGWAVAGDMDAIALPPSIEAILGARIDRLRVHERSLLQRAAVIGRIFGRAAVAHLTPLTQRPTLPVNLEELTAKEFVRADSTQLAGDEAYRFNHILTRDAAYRGLPKGDRSDLHERFATWLEETSGERAAEVEELIGYHLEQSTLYRRELGPLGEVGHETMRRAAERLESAGRRALLRGDLAAAENLLARAVSLTPTDEPVRVDRQISLGGALLSWGAFDEAERVLGEAIENAGRLEDEDRRCFGLVARAFGRVLTDPSAQVAEIPDLVAQAMPVFEASRNELGLARVWQLQAELHRLHCQYQADAEALETALEHARRAGAPREIASIDSWLGNSIMYGPTPVDEGIARGHAMLERAKGVRWFESGAHAMLAFLEALRGNIDEARALYATRRAHLEELGMALPLAVTSSVPATIELLAYRPDEAERELRWGYDRLAEVGETETRSTIAARLARVLYELDRHDEAYEMTIISEDLTAEDDVTSQVLWRSARAKVLARRDADPVAEQLALEAVGRALASDGFDIRGDAYLDLAETRRSLRKEAEAADAAQAAIEVFEAKGATALVALARALVASAA